MGLDQPTPLFLCSFKRMFKFLTLFAASLAVAQAASLAGAFRASAGFRPNTPSKVLVYSQPWLNGGEFMAMLDDDFEGGDDAACKVHGAILLSIVQNAIDNSTITVGGTDHDYSNFVVESLTSFGDAELATKLAAASFSFMTGMEFRVWSTITESRRTKRLPPDAVCLWSLGTKRNGPPDSDSDAIVTWKSNRNGIWHR